MIIVRTMKSRLLVVVLFLALLTLSCNLPVVGQVTTPGTAVSTQGTSSPGTGTALAFTTVTPQPTGPSFTQAATAAAVVPTTAVPPTATPVCDQAQFLADVTVADGEKMTPGQSFSKTWRLRNIGTCTWTPSYAIVFTDGDSLDAPAAVSLTGNVPPGADVDLTIPMKAPTAVGKYYGDWMLRNAGGQLFGVVGNQPFYIQIEVVSPITPTVTATPTPTVTAILTPTLTQTVPAAGTIYDFTTEACKAEWRSLAGVLDCRDTQHDENGYVRILSNPRLETGVDFNGAVLLTQPQKMTDGAITGTYPAILIQNGYHFTASLGCLSGADLCSVIYQLNYTVNGGSPVNLGQWSQVYDRTIQNIDVDLSKLAGMNVKIVLVVLANGTAEGDQALWVSPRIVK